MDGPIMWIFNISSIIVENSQSYSFSIIFQDSHEVTYYTSRLKVLEVGAGEVLYTSPPVTWEWEHEQENALKKKSILSPNNASVGYNSNRKTERQRKRGRELFLDKYLVMGYNDA